MGAPVSESLLALYGQHPAAIIAVVNPLHQLPQPHKVYLSVFRRILQGLSQICVVLGGDRSYRQVWLDLVVLRGESAFSEKCKLYFTRMAVEDDVHLLSVGDLSYLGCFKRTPFYWNVSNKTPDGALQTSQTPARA